MFEAKSNISFSMHMSFFVIFGQVSLILLVISQMEIHIEGYLQHNRYDGQEGKGTDNVEQTL